MILENKRENTNRLFIAIVPPLEIRRQVNLIYRSMTKEARNFRFVNPEQLHITLKFLGNDISKNSQEIITAFCENVKKDYSSFDLDLVSVTFGFPKQILPTILYMDIEDVSGSFSKMIKDIHNGLKAHELVDVKREKEYKSLFLHMTIGRAKHSVSRSFSRKIFEEIKKLDFQKLSFKVDRFYLMRSKFDRGLTTYQILNEFQLG